MRAVADQAKAAPSSSEQLAVAFRAAIFAQDGPPFWRIAFASSKRPSLSRSGAHPFSRGGGERGLGAGRGPAKTLPHLGH